MALQVVRVNEGLESEKQRLSHLRDRASETGRRKELRECVEKLQLLNTPEERSRRMNQIPEIHVDPKMDPENESQEEEEEKSPEINPASIGRPRESSFRKDKYIFPPTSPVSSKWVSNKDKRETNVLDDKTEEPPWNQPKDFIDPSVWNSDTSANTNTTAAPPPPPPDDIKEREKIWNYRDPAGNIQGPFSMLQLRKWNTTGLFPFGMKVWRSSETEDDSILLSDALNGKFEKDLPQPELPAVNNPQPTAGPAQSFSTLSAVLPPRDANTIIGQLQPQIQNIPRPITPSIVNQYGSVPNHVGSWSSNIPAPPQPIVTHQGYGPQQPNWDPHSSNQWVPQGLFHAVAATPTQAAQQQSANVPPWRSANLPPPPPPPGTTTHSVYPSWSTVNTPPPLPGTYQPPTSALNGNFCATGLLSAISHNVANTAVIPSNQVISNNPSNVVSKNQFFVSDCPSPTPTNERLGSAEMHSNTVNRVPRDSMSPIRQNTMNSDKWSMPSPTPAINSWQEERSIGWNKANQASMNLWSKGEDRDIGRYGRESSHDASRHGGSYSRHDSRYDDEDSRRDSRYDDHPRRDSRYEDDYSRRDSRHREDSRREPRYGGYERSRHDRRGRRSRTPPRDGKSQGICKFHEGGHCKKGAACNYAHS